MLTPYFRKMLGHSRSPARAHMADIFWSWVGAFLGIAAVAYINFSKLAQTDQVYLIASFGASAVLLYGVVESPLAQPRNLVGGHVLSALIGVSFFHLLGSQTWLAAAGAVATAIAVMHVSKTLHPPGGATALIAVIGSDQIHALGYRYALIPAGLGALIMLVIALFVNNIPHHRRYPHFWF
ncbi:MAG: HPP family protein [Candidatus Lindowbacteria bacterium]|nr:HPP family protein [Candidatus Lindowbacteria bacterium]